MRAPVTVADVAARVGGIPHGDRHRPLTGVQHDSRAVAAGDLFAAVPGATVDGARFVPEALARGAAAVLARSPVADLPVPQIVVGDVRAALGPAAERVYGEPTSDLTSVGVTGTNGKTTVTWLLDATLRGLGARPALLGTVVARRPGGAATPAALTTPEADDVARFARAAVDDGGTHLLMEVSSIALDQRRADGVAWDVVAFTNLSRDHLDYHRTLEAYGAAKARLFRELGGRATWVVHVDDAFGAQLAADAPRGARVIRCSTAGDAAAAIRVREARLERGGLRATVATPDGDVALASPLVGAHNLENLLVALGVTVALGHDAREAAVALGEAPAAPGRLERIEGDDDVAVFVDYAHTPDALGRVLAALRPITPGRLVVVFGCGGDRDRGKRGPMGAVGAGESDLALLTSDNPRTEAPEAILAAVADGARGTGRPRLDAEALHPGAAPARGWLVEEDRRRAIHMAVAQARPGDTVLVAGKGHEPYQILGTRKTAFDDRDEARRALAARGRGRP